MIKLVVVSDSHSSITRCFDQPIIIIGSATSDYADICLPGENLQDIHIRIVLENSRYFAINAANDPFVTLNGKPFGKKVLLNNDTIDVHNTCFRCELSTLPHHEFKLHCPIFEEKKIPQPPHEHTILQTHFEEMASLDVHKTLSDRNEDDSNFIDIDALVKQVEELAEIEEAAFENREVISESLERMEEFKSSDSFYSEGEGERELNQTPHPVAQQFATINLTNGDSHAPSAPQPFNPIPKPSLKDYYLSEYDDLTEHSHQNIPPHHSLIPPSFISIGNWQAYVKILLAFLCLMGIGIGLAYLWISDQSDREEMNASKGVADVAMALTYAQIKHIRPQNQNWSDPEFIKNNLTAVLSSKYSFLADFDNHGQFTNCPYMLRIYTSGDLTQFLVIAQPAPSLLQWLIPKATIVVDSRAMEMRKIKDLKSLNRLLVNANTLDGTSAVEVSNLIRQGGLIPLSSLVYKGENLGFSPPKALGLIRPGAENFVYNAPRYHLLGEDVMKKSSDLIEKNTESHDIATLQQELEILSKYPNIIFYSSGGIQNAIHAQKSLSTLFPRERFLIAYLQLNSQGHIVNNQLLMDDAPSEIASSDSAKSHMHQHINLAQPTSNNAAENVFPTNETASSITLTQLEINEDNPLFLQLSALNTFRQQALRQICDEIIALLNKETQLAQPMFISRAQQLFTKYFEVNKEQQTKILKKLDSIYRENTHFPASQFLNLAKAAGLEEPLRDYLNFLKQQMHVPEITQEQMEKHLHKIEKTSNWQDFEQQVAETVEILNLERIPEEERVVAYQNATRSRVIQKLNQFLLSSEHTLPSQSFEPEYRYTLIHILKMGWITDSDTYDFYLSEFDLRTTPRSHSDSDEE